MPLYPFACECGVRTHAFRTVENRDQPEPCECGREMGREFSVEVGFYVPPYHRAPGSSGSSSDSCDRQAVYLQSDQHRKDMKQAERIQERDLAAKRSLEDLKDRIKALPIAQ